MTVNAITFADGAREGHGALLQRLSAISDTLFAEKAVHFRNAGDAVLPLGGSG